MPSSLISSWMLDRIQSGQAVLFLGTGATKGARGRNGETPLSSDQLRDKLSDKYLGGKKKEKNLVKVADYCKSQAGLDEVQDFIKQLLYPLYPAEFHKLISAFRWWAIVTTNYDLMVERAYDSSPNKLQILAKRIRDDESFSESIRDPRAVLYLKLHGCIETTRDPSVPLILGSEEYAKYRKNRGRLFDHFKEWGREHPIIFCGYDIADPNIQQILFDLSDATINRPYYLVVSPDLDELDEQLWQQRRFSTLRMTFENFLHEIDTAIPLHKRSLVLPASTSQSSITRFISTHASPSEQLTQYLLNEIEHAYAGMSSQGQEPEQYYRGRNDSWAPYIQEYDVRRRVTDDIISDLLFDDANSTFRVFLMKGHAGSGKSAVLRRVAIEASRDYSALVFWLKDGGIIRPNLFREVYTLTNIRMIFFVEDFLGNKEDILGLITYARHNSIPIDIVVGARTNEFNVYGDELAPLVTKEYETRNLSRAEALELIDKLEKYNCLGDMKNKTREERLKYFQLTADRQLLVALHEATYGKPFEDILSDEYRNLTPSEAKILYLDICTLNRLGVGVRAGLISRVSEINFEHFKEKLFKPLEHVVRAVYDTKDRDYLYKTRHPIIAGIVFEQILSSQKERADQIIRMLRYMNVDYEADSAAFTEVIKGKTIAEMFSNRSYGEQIYRVALETTARASHILHQQAVFELSHPNGRIELAAESIKRAEQLSDHQSKSIAHTKALVLRQMAQKSRTSVERDKYRRDSKQILDGLVSGAYSTYPIHTMVELSIDELHDKLEEMKVRGAQQESDFDRRVLVTMISKCEEVLHRGLVSFPDDPYLHSSEIRLASLLQNESRVLEVLEKSFSVNPSHGYIAVRLARCYKEQGNQEKSENILLRCLESNPTCKEVHLELALLLIAVNEQLNSTKILQHLRASFTDGDINYDAQFWCARHNFLYGDRRRAYSLFGQLKSVRMPVNIRTKARGPVIDPLGATKRYKGIVRTLTDSYCFIASAELGVDVFAHYTYFNENEWNVVQIQTSVEFSLAFSFSGPIGVEIKISN